MIPYPWFGVIVTSMLLGIATLVFQLILCPRAGVLRWRRVALAVLIASMLFFVSAAAVPSDVPGYFYAPILYGLVSAIILLPVGAAMVHCSRAREPSFIGLSNREHP